jgi:HEPN domain-containing protein
MDDAKRGFLVYHDQRVARTHDIGFLLNQAATLEGDLADFYDHAERLTPYATAFRYPDEILEPTREEFAAALSAAEEICSVLFGLLPEDVRPARAPRSEPESPPTGETSQGHARDPG